jgi:tetratricopeptide (TPR) repeat protein
MTKKPKDNPPDSPEVHPARRVAVVCAVLAAATILVYLPVSRYDMVNYDDRDYVYQNIHVSDGLTWADVAWAFKSVEQCNWHPLTWLSHMLDSELFGVRAGGKYLVDGQRVINGHHLVNLGLHVAATVLLVLVLLRMTGLLWPSAIVAALFALHPLHVESVAWIAERKDVLSAVFFMLTLLAYVRYAERPGVARYLPVFFLLTLGLMAKPMLVTVPFVLLLLDYWPLGRYPLRMANGELRIQTAPARGFFKSAIRNPQSAISFGRTSTLRLVLEKTPLFLPVVALSIVTYRVQDFGGAMHYAGDIPLPTRLSTALVGYVTYLGQMVWPVGLTVFYPYIYDRPVWQPVLAAAFLAFVTILVVREVRRRPYLAVGWFWYLGMLVPVIGFIQVGRQAYADRYTYLTLIGIFIALVWAANDVLASRPDLKKAMTVLAVGVAGACMLLTSRQLPYWSDTETMFLHALDLNPDNALAHGKVGECFMDQGQPNEALDEYMKQLQLAPDDADAHNSVGSAYLAQGRSAEAEQYFRKAIALGSSRVGVFHSNLAAALYTQNKIADAVAECHLALQLDPTLSATRSNLGVALLASGRVDEAIAEQRESLRANPRAADTHMNLAIALGHAKKTAEALAEFTEALRLNPNLADAHRNIAILLLQQGQPGQALIHMKEALRLRPDMLDHLNLMAHVLATHPESSIRNGPEAVALAERACELSERGDPVCLDTLAEAYAEAGQFPKAVDVAREAAALARKLKHDDLADHIAARQRLYEARSPYRQAPVAP